jgi:hypothetical protein
MIFPLKHIKTSISFGDFHGFPIAKWPLAQPWHPAGSSDHLHLNMCTKSTI